MDGVYLRICTTEKRKHDGMLLYEWLLEQARGMGISGGSAFRAIAGYGRHKRLHEETHFELASDAPVELVFVLTQAQADGLLQLIAAEGLSLLYLKSRVKWAYTGSN